MINEFDANAAFEDTMVFVAIVMTLAIPIVHDMAANDMTFIQYYKEILEPGLYHLQRFAAHVCSGV